MQPLEPCIFYGSSSKGELASFASTLELHHISDILKCHSAEAQAYLIFFCCAPFCAVEDAYGTDVILLQLLRKFIPPPDVVVGMRVGTKVQSLRYKSSVAVKNPRINGTTRNVDGCVYMTIRFPFRAFSLSGKYLKTVGLNGMVSPR